MFKGNTTYLFLPILAMSLTFGGCRKQGQKEEAAIENIAAKKNLQGIWLDENGEDVAFRIKGDSVYFPDSASAPSYFRVVSDTLVMEGQNNVTKYAIVKQTPHIFVFVNTSGERIKLVKTEDSSFMDMFLEKQPIALNQNRLVKRDTIVYHDNEKYHCYVQINPTSYKVAKTTYNDDGVAVDNIYYDNIIHLSIFNGNDKLFSRDFRKSDFGKYIEASALQQSVFSDLTLNGIDGGGFHYFATMAIPDSSSSYMVELTIGFDGKLAMRIKNTH